MRLVIQRVASATLSADGRPTAQIKRGLLILAAVSDEDTDGNRIKKLASKVVKLRIFEDESEKMNLAVKDINGEILVVPQFTLYANTNGNRPYFGKAARPDMAKSVLDAFVAELKTSGLVVAQGVFGAYMEIEAKLDGPVTIILDS